MIHHAFSTYSLATIFPPQSPPSLFLSLAPFPFSSEAHGGDFFTELMDSGGGLTSNAGALARFSQVHASWGTGAPGGARTGSLPGTESRMEYIGSNGASFAFVLNSRQGIQGGIVEDFGAQIRGIVAPASWTAI